MSASNISQPGVVFHPWSAFPGAKPCLTDAPAGLKVRHGTPLVCTREKDHSGEHAVGVDGTVSWVS